MNKTEKADRKNEIERAKQVIRDSIKSRSPLNLDIRKDSERVYTFQIAYSEIAKELFEGLSKEDREALIDFVTDNKLNHL